MAFSRNWDETFPADTQLANLLGQDIRNFKIDIRERFSAMAGTFANRPSIGDMATNWGNSAANEGNGPLYFSTDTGKIYQWNGSAWVDVTSGIFPFPAGVAGDWAVGGNLNVTGFSTLGGGASTPNLVVAGSTTTSSLHASGSIQVDGNETVNGTLNALGVSTLNNGPTTGVPVISGTNPVTLTWDGSQLAVFIDTNFIGHVTLHA